MARENSGTSVISRYLNERVSFVYDISIEEIVSEMSQRVCRELQPGSCGHKQEGKGAREEDS